jgi:hypothetical protein
MNAKKMSALIGEIFNVSNTYLKNNLDNDDALLEINSALAAVLVALWHHVQQRAPHTDGGKSYFLQELEIWEDQKDEITVTRWLQ